MSPNTESLKTGCSHPDIPVASKYFRLDQKRNVFTYRVCKEWIIALDHLSEWDHQGYHFREDIAIHAYIELMQECHEYMRCLDNEQEAVTHLVEEHIEVGLSPEGQELIARSMESRDKYQHKARYTHEQAQLWLEWGNVQLYVFTKGEER